MCPYGDRPVSLPESVSRSMRLRRVEIRRKGLGHPGHSFMEPTNQRISSDSMARHVVPCASLNLDRSSNRGLKAGALLPCSSIRTAYPLIQDRSSQTEQYPAKLLVRFNAESHDPL